MTDEERATAHEIMLEMREEWCIPIGKASPRPGSARMFKLKGTRSDNGSMTWVLRFYSIEHAAWQNLKQRWAFRKEARELREKEQLTFINY